LIYLIFNFTRKRKKGKCKKVK